MIDQAVIPSVIRPFPGLRQFRKDEAHLFFGREGQTDALIRKLACCRFLAVVGASGGGKSSLVRAGLLPALMEGYLAKAGTHWRFAEMRPGSDPVGRLSEALAKAGLGSGTLPDDLRKDPGAIIKSLESALSSGALRPGANLLILADQFEELFRYETHRDGAAADRDEKAVFVQHLIDCSRQRAVPIYVVVTMRSEFLGDCARFRELPEQINDGQYLVPRLTREQRRLAIEGPIGVAGASISPKLVQRLLNDFGDEADQLPVMQHALMRTWSRWLSKGEESDPEARADPIDIEDYDAIGGFENALSMHAQEAFAEVCNTNEARGAEIVKRTFLLLRTRDDRGREVRRPTSISEIMEVTESPIEQVRQVIQSFSGPERTFLFASDELLNPFTDIDITHESLLRKWPLLATEWVREETESVRIYTRLAKRAAEDWSDYLQGTTLRETSEWWKLRRPNAAWATRYHPGFDSAKQLLEVSQKHQAHARRLKWLLGLVCLIAIGVYPVYLLRENLVQAQLLAAQAGAKVSESENLLQEGAFLAAASFKLRHTIEAQTVLARTLSLIPSPLTTFRHPGAVMLGYSPDSKYLASASSDGKLKLWSVAADDSTKNDPIGELPFGDSISGLAWSKDTLLVATKNEIKFVSPSERRITGTSTCLNPQLLVNDDDDDAMAVCGGALQVWIPKKDEAGLRAFLPFKLSASDMQGTRAPRLLALDRWDQADGKQRVVVAVVLSGKKVQDCVVVLSHEATDNDHGESGLHQVARACSDGPMGTSVASIQFDPKRASLLVAQDDNTVRSWHFDRPDSVDTALTVMEPVYQLTKDAQFLLSVDGGRTVNHGASQLTIQGGSIHMWQVPGRAELARFTPREPLTIMDIRSDGLQAAGLDGQGNILRWDLSHNVGEFFDTLQADPGIEKAVFARDGRTLALTTRDSAMVLDLIDENLKLQWPPGPKSDGPPDPKAPHAARIFSDGSKVLLRQENGAILMSYSLDRTGKLGKALWSTPVAFAEFQGTPVFNPDESLLAVVRRQGADRRLFLCNAQTGKDLNSWPISATPEPVDPEKDWDLVLGFLGDGRTVLLRSETGLRLFHPETGVSKAPVDLRSSPAASALDQNGQRLALGECAGPESSIRIFDTSSWKELFKMKVPGRLTSVAFSPDRTYLMTASDDNIVRVWELRNGRERGRFLDLQDVKSLGMTQDGRVWVVQSFRLTRHAFGKDMISDLCARAGPELSKPDRDAYRFTTEVVGTVCK